MHALNPAPECQNKHERLKILRMKEVGEKYCECVHVYLSESDRTAEEKAIEIWNK